MIHFKDSKLRRMIINLISFPTKSSFTASESGILSLWSVQSFTVETTGTHMSASSDGGSSLSKNIAMKIGDVTRWEGTAAVTWSFSPTDERNLRHLVQPAVK